MKDPNKLKVGDLLLDSYTKSIYKVMTPDPSQLKEVFLKRIWPVPEDFGHLYNKTFPRMQDFFSLKNEKQKVIESIFNQLSF